MYLFGWIIWFGCVCVWLNSARMSLWSVLELLGLALDPRTTTVDPSVLVLQQPGLEQGCIFTGIIRKR